MVSVLIISDFSRLGEVFRREYCIERRGAEMQRTHITLYLSIFAFNYVVASFEKYLFRQPQYLSIIQLKAQ